MALTYFPAIDNPKPASVLAIARQLILYIPLMIFLPKYFGIGGIYYGATAIDVVITICIVLLLLKSFKTLDYNYAVNESLSKKTNDNPKN